jgi:hypothetical protein
MNLSVCTEYKVQGLIITSKTLNFCALCDVLDEEILDVWECVEKYQQLFYITF